jgi:rRNA maturation protein Rpf1
MFTTSRYSSEGTRKVAGRIAKENGEPYVARGKKTIDSLVEEARRCGESTLNIIEERKGEAAIISTIRIDEMGKWAWAGEKPLQGGKP